MTKVHVIYKGRTFIVKSDERGVYSIYERRVYQPGRPWESLYDYPQWHISMGMPKRGNIFKIMQLAGVV